MHVSIGLLTYRRPDFLKTTLHTLKKTTYPHTLTILDNASKDEETSKILATARAHVEVVDNPLFVGTAMNRLVASCQEYNPDLIVLTADDYAYVEDWLEKLVNWWKEAPHDIAITSMNWEPLYPWNSVQDTVTYGGQKGLIRSNIPGSSWSFRADMWPEIGPLQHITGGEDLSVCTKLRTKLYKLAALDLSQHIGERESAWGNNSWKMARPLEF